MKDALQRRKVLRFQAREAFRVSCKREENAKKSAWLIQRVCYVFHRKRIWRLTEVP
jgi:hypothetical protein